MRRVVVTGSGIVSPIGIGVDPFWKALLSGTSGVKRITRFDPTGYDCQIAAEVKDFDPLSWIDKKEIRKMDTFVQYAIAAGLLAVDYAQLTESVGTRER